VPRQPPHLRPDARQQFLHVERLREIIVGARVHAGDLVAPAIACRQDDDRHLAVGPPPLFKDRNAVHLRQAEVEDDDVIGFGLAEEEPFFSVVRGVDGKARPRERLHELTIEIPVVFDNECAQRSSPGCLRRLIALAVPLSQRLIAPLVAKPLRSRPDDRTLELPRRRPNDQAVDEPAIALAQCRLDDRAVERDERRRRKVLDGQQSLAADDFAGKPPIVEAVIFRHRCGRR
jgi:hypothetical protein